MSKPLAKSLHTVTVLVRVATLHLDRMGSDGDTETRNMIAVMAALKTLGLIDAPDTYGLAAAAIKQLNK